MNRKNKIYLSFCTFAVLWAFALPSLAITPKSNWADSYSVNGKCYCATTFDHGIGNFTYTTPAGKKTVKEICNKIGKGPGKGNNPVYNTVQCGHEPGHSDPIKINGKDVKDEKVCPGRVDQGSGGCNKKGPKWDLSVFESQPSSSSSSSGQPSSSSSSSGAAVVTKVDTSGATIQAEDYANAKDNNSGNRGKAYRNGDVDIQKTADAGGGFNVGWIDDGEWLSYDLDVQAEGSYEVSVRVASTKDSGMFSISVDGDLRVSNQSIPNTGNWQSFETFTFDLGDLVEGKRELRFSIGGGGFNVNWFKLVPVEDTMPDPVEPDPVDPDPVDSPENLQDISFDFIDRGSKGLQVDVTSKLKTADVATVGLYLNGSFIRVEKKAPYNWNHKGFTDSALIGLNGTHAFKAIFTLKSGNSYEYVVPYTP